MTTSFLPQPLRDAAAHPTGPRAVVEAFLAALAARDFAAATSLLAEDVTYINVGMPTLRGRRRAMALLRPLGRPGASFEVYLHAVAVEGDTVLTDRTDVLILGAVRMQFWVTGRFEVRDGQIAYWRDSFDYLDLFRAFVRGLVGAVVPRVRPAAPSSPDVEPGRH